MYGLLYCKRGIRAMYSKVTPYNRLQNEMHCYMSEPEIDIEMDTSNWWKDGLRDGLFN